MDSASQINPPDFDGQSGNMWDHARREYLSGMKATAVCQRYGMSLSSFRLHARAGGWRRMDRADCDVEPEAGEYHPDDPVSFTDLADQAFLNIRRALGRGRASEASTWMRVYDKLAERARAEVMADLPDVPPPVSNREPLLLFATGPTEANDFKDMDWISPTESELLDSLDSTFSESVPTAHPPNPP